MFVSVLCAVWRWEKKFFETSQKYCHFSSQPSLSQEIFQENFDVLAGGWRCDEGWSSAEKKIGNEFFHVIYETWYPFTQILRNQGKIPFILLTQDTRSLATSYEGQWSKRITKSSTEEIFFTFNLSRRQSIHSIHDETSSRETQKLVHHFPLILSRSDK